MSELVKRPQSVGKKINCVDEFELCYLRHQYLRKSEFNPTDAEMKPYYGIINRFAKRNNYIYSNLFKHVGFEAEDLVNIGKVHLVSYLCLFSISFNSERKDQFIDKFFDLRGDFPDERHILEKDKANFTDFLKQRYMDIVRIARQKVRNIRGVLSDEFLVYYSSKPPEPGVDLVKDFQKNGFKKLSFSLFKSLKNMLKDQSGPVYFVNNLYYVVIELDHRQITAFDLIGADIDPRDDLHNMNPEQLLILKDTEAQNKKIKKKWKLMGKEDRNNKLIDFILAKSGDPLYSEEIVLAQRYIKE